MSETKIYSSSEVVQRIVEGYDRVATTNPADTVAMAVAFMAVIDLIGEDAHDISVAEMFLAFQEVFAYLTELEAD